MVYSVRVALKATFIVALTSGLLTARSLQPTYPGHEKSSLQAAAPPSYCAAMHNVGRLAMAITNYGVIGDGYLIEPGYDCFTNQLVPSCEYPKGSGSKYLYAGAIWVGAIKGSDTLVSVGNDGWQDCRELNPDASPVGDLIYKSTLSADPVIRDGAVSEQDYIAAFTDTFGSSILCTDFLDHRPHVPLPIQISQRSYAWSDPVAEDFVIFDCTVRNIGVDTLREVYIGLQIDGDVMGDPQDESGFLDDIAGFRRVPLLTHNGCDGYKDSIPVAWIADNDGDLSSQHPCRAVTGVALLRTALNSARLSFNWWIPNVDSNLDYGPYRKATYRDFTTGGTGTPEGDRNKYYMLSSGEIDFDQVYTAKITSEDTSWGAPDSLLVDPLVPYADPRYLLSFGPMTLAPGDSQPFTYAYVAGENLHSVAGNLNYLPDHPDAYMANLNFSDLDNNVRSAAWLVDNPGVDTDGDGFKGFYVLCGGDTLYVTGDHSPDFAPYHELSCCVGNRGNVNGSSDDFVNLSDLTLLVSYLISPPGALQLPCYHEADINGRGVIDLSDLTLLVLYLTSPPGAVTLPTCP